MFIWPEIVDTLPPPFDAARADRMAERLAEASFASADDRFDTLLRFVAGSSPYLARSMGQEPALIEAIAARGPQAVIADEIAAAAAAKDAASRDDLFKALRLAKRRVALAIALGDVGGVLTLDQVTAGLTELADAAVRSALAFALKAEVKAGRYRSADPDDPAKGSGIIVLAMGKYGAFELNYSSDIDFTVFFERETLPVADGVEPVPFLVRVIQAVVKALQDRTGDGYVFRTDLRLRPDAGATQIAIPVDAALSYYEGMGQNWERAAMIKARPCAGDIAAGENLLRELRPFVWRKYLDFAAVEDIHSIKRQIHAHKGGAAVTIPGHDVKLGRGGIREIEFFVQTQQLILGGRYPVLRHRRTLDSLHELTREDVVSREAERDLEAAYIYLRTLEHRIQMIADEQTHSLPEDAADRANIARFMGFAEAAPFEAKTLSIFRSVERHYAALFESSAALGTTEGSLVFTGVDDDPETLRTLAGQGFKRPASLSAAIRAWHHGRMPATRSQRARELLTGLMPSLLDALAKTPDPDTAFARFDALLRGLPAGVQVFSLIKANPWLLESLAEVCGAAPRLAMQLARSPALLDAVLHPDFFVGRLTQAEIETAFDRSLGEASSYEAMLDAARRTARELGLRVGLQLLRGAIGPEAVGTLYAMVAEAVLVRVAQRVRQAFAAQHGTVEAGVFAIVAMGRLGAAKMTAASDLDLVFLYDHAPGAEQSNGPQPLAPSVYFARLSQRLIAAVTSATAEGKLYDVDMRLRPSGNSGPLSVRLETFEAYQAKEAWTWERMALTRARLIAADDGFDPRVRQAILTALTRRVPPDTIRGDAAAMRGRLLRDKPAKSPFDLKLVRGGMTDIEFIAQATLLIAGPDHPDIFTGATLEALRRLSSVGALARGDAEALGDAYYLYSAVNHVLRLTSEDDAKAVEETALQRLLVRAAKATNFDSLEAALDTAKADVAARFDRLIGAPN